MSINTLREQLSKLRLAGMAGKLDIRLQEAMANSLEAKEFLELMVQDELMNRANNKMKSA